MRYSSRRGELHKLRIRSGSGDAMRYTESTGSYTQAQGKVGFRRESEIHKQEWELHKLRLSYELGEDVRS
jgi:hypothetical protein